MAPAYKQDMPPPGGYARIVYERIPAKQITGPFSLLAAFIASTSIGIFFWRIQRDRMQYEKIERRDAKIALEPFLLAERDRAFIKQIRKNREEEANLMKDVPGWEVGTYYGEPIYKTVPDNEWRDLLIEEYYVHAHPKHYRANALFHIYH